jgi:hypothetical protein
MRIRISQFTVIRIRFANHADLDTKLECPSSCIIFLQEYEIAWSGFNFEGIARLIFLVIFCEISSFVRTISVPKFVNMYHFLFCRTEKGTGPLIVVSRR